MIKTRKPRLQSLYVVAALAVLPSLCGEKLRADVPRLIQYQGKLATTSGVSLVGPVSIRTRLFDHPTQTFPVLFDETHPNVALNRGLFSIIIGSLAPGGLPDTAMANSAVYLGVSIDGAAELSPRRRIVTAPFTLRAEFAEKLVRPGSVSPAVSVDAAGRVGVGTSNVHASAAVEVASNSGGFLPPRMTSAERDLISAPATGLQIFNTTTSCIEFFVGGVWQVVACGCSGAPATPGAIDGPTSNCPADPLAVYSVSAVFGATTYGWTVPPGAVIVSGQGTPTITVDFGASSGNIIVNAANACGTSADRALAVNVVSSAEGFQTITTAGDFVVPECISSVRVLVVGGGGGGGGGHIGGAGSGHVRVGTFAVTPGEIIPVTVGTGGSGGPGGPGANNNGTSQPGTGSSFGSYLSASAGSGVVCWSCCNCAPGGNGGSGGGGAGCCNSRTVGAAGGSGGSNGGATSQQPGGTGGNFDSLSPLIRNSFSAGAGGAGGMGTSGDFGGGGGGAGGVLINGSGPSAGNGSDGASARGGQGYGAGGGAGGYNSSTYFFGGAGAPGVVYVEW